MSFESMWAAIADIGRDPSSGGYRRFAWSDDDQTLRGWFAGECAGRGLDLTEDRMGNQWAWWGDPDAAVARGEKGVVTGSHLDSVPDGGAFDGPLGVVSALAAVDALRASGFTPRVPIAVVNFVDEEGARFGVACVGSRVITGALSPERALGLTDADGFTMAEALTEAGRDAGAVGRDDETLARVGAFVELHVEQGRALADPEHPAYGHAVAIGSGIWPHGRWRLDFPGEANHAGTTRLEHRHDAMLGFAETVLAARWTADKHGAVATMGKVQVVPNGVNAIPSAVTGWLDARGAEESAVRAMVAEISGTAMGARAALTEESWTPKTVFDTDLVARLQTRLGGVPLLGTGAGHDAGILSTAGIPAAMLFVRNPTGVSHSPAERAQEKDCLAGVDALAAVLEDLAG